MQLWKEVGKNLKNFLIQNNIKCKTISRSTFQKNKLPLISDCGCFVHLVGLGIETKKKSFEEINVELTKKVIDLCKKSNIDYLKLRNGNRYEK